MLQRNFKHHLSRHKKAAFYAAFFIISFFLAACQTPKEHLEDLAKFSSLNQPLTLNTPFFTLVGYGKNRETSHVNIYIEGDGRSWLDPWTVSPDPSPADPVGFRLALADTRPSSVLYLARPCQYYADHRCTFRDWTSDRFSSKVIRAYHDALNQIRTTWKARTFTLHGYSGGATVALLIAASRQDVTAVVTFAPLLDPDAWVKYHRYSPLSGSLSPLNYAQSLRLVPQTHFIGLEDEQVPWGTLTPYFELVPESSQNSVHKIPGFGHNSDWPDLWKSYILKGK